MTRNPIHAPDLTGLPEAIIRTTYVSLSSLVKAEPIAFLELVELARSDQQGLGENPAQVALSLRGLVDPPGRLHEAVREVVLASTVGDGLDLRLRPLSEVIPEAFVPSPVTPEPMTDEQKADLIAQCLRIAEIFDEEFPDSVASSEGHRAGGINSFYKKTASGLYLEFYYGYPAKIWTPWGYWKFASTSGGSRVEKQGQLRRFMSRLTADLHTALEQSKFGDYGPVYKLVAVEGVPLPRAGDVMEVVPSADYETLKAEWERLGGPHMHDGTE